jgi:hypothetical protein
MTMEIKHFSRISGMKKKNDKGGDYFWQDHYRYYGKVFKIKPREHVMIVLCDNCDENHAYNSHNCELIYDQRKQIETIYLFNCEIDEMIYIYKRQTIGEIYIKYLGLIYGTGKIISEKNLFTTVTQCQKNENCISRYCIYNPTKCPLINIHRETDNKQILCNLYYGWTFFCVCHPFMYINYYFYLTSEHNLISVQCSNPNIRQYYIICENNTPPSLFNLSLSNIAQHKLNHILDSSKNILPSNICEKTPKCHQNHLLPFGMRRYNPHCTGNGEYSPLISNW